MAKAHEDKTVTSLLNPAAKPPTLEVVTYTQAEAAEVSRLSAKTLERHWQAGEPVGRIKIGRRVVYLRSALEAWLISKATPAV
jgi:hypothetical protein